MKDHNLHGGTKRGDRFHFLGKRRLPESIRRSRREKGCSMGSGKEERWFPSITEKFFLQNQSPTSFRHRREPVSPTKPPKKRRFFSKGPQWPCPREWGGNSTIGDTHLRGGIKILNQLLHGKEKNSSSPVKHKCDLGTSLWFTLTLEKQGTEKYRKYWGTLHIYPGRKHELPSHASLREVPSWSHSK